MTPPPLGVQAVATEPGVTPTAFLAVVEYVDADGETHMAVIASNGITEARTDRLRSVLGAPPPPRFDRIVGGHDNTKSGQHPGAPA